MKKSEDINEKANSFLSQLSKLLVKDIKYKREPCISENESLLIQISSKLNEGIDLFNFSLNPYSDYLNGWDMEFYSAPVGMFNGDWININYKTNEVEVHYLEYYYFDLFYKIAKNEDSFLILFLELAKIIGEYGYDKNYLENKLFLGFNIYERRVLAEKFTHMAGGEIYFEFWENYWTSWSDERILKAGPNGYGLDLPDTIKQDGDKYVWV